jgi:protein gp37
MKKTSITWADYTWNPITGCTRGCGYCYARKLTKRFPAAFPNGFEPTFHPDRLDEPTKVKKLSIVFVGSMGDLFDPTFSDSEILSVFEAMGNASQHTFMLLTKRADRMYEVSPCLPNVMYGATVASNSDKERLVLLRRLALAGYHTFVSIEPMQGEVTFLTYIERAPVITPGITAYSRRPVYVVVGGITPAPPLHETHPDWLESVIGQCQEHHIPVHYKHAGTNPEFMGRVWNELVDGRWGKRAQSNR